MTQEVMVKDYRQPDGSVVPHTQSYTPDSMPMKYRIRHAVELVNDRRASRICCPGQWRVFRCELTGAVVIERPLYKARRILGSVSATRQTGACKRIRDPGDETL